MLLTIRILVLILADHLSVVICCCSVIAADAHSKMQNAVFVSVEFGSMVVDCSAVHHVTAQYVRMISLSTKPVARS